MIQKLLAGALALLLIGAGIAWWRTTPPSPQIVAKRTAALTSAGLVDESSYATAQRLAALATTPVEQPLAQSALRIADHELALAFTAALRDVEAHPPPLSPAALKIQDRLQKSQSLLDADQQRVMQMTADLATAKSVQKDQLQDELGLAQSQFDLDKDEVEEASQALVAAGGNPQQRIEAMVQEHDAQVKARAGLGVGAGQPAAGVLQHGSLSTFRSWLALRQKLALITEARDGAVRKAATLGEQRTALTASLEDAKGGIAELSQHTQSAKAAGAVIASPPVTHSHENATTLLNQTKLITANQRVLTLLERQTLDQRELAGVYQRWIADVTSQSIVFVHSLTLDAAIVIGIVLVLLMTDRWVQHLLDNPKLDRRQVETLRSVTRVGMRVLGVLVILLILIGVPTQLGTIIGIVGAGLTVALKDFIVAFFGWLMLMGRNGIRLGDWVEINGVSGEVTELGMFHTVLLETGNWSDAGHPTGRRVTFTNSFAIEGHYFNFSTSGQWLWDELQVVVPAGQDPYPIVDAITQRVVDATAEGARQAEQEWQRAVPSQRGKTFSGTPGVNVKPVVGGIEISVRYITRAHERFQVRAKLYQAAVDLLGQKPLLQPPPATA